jgi:MmyB-like transcription regulator ligand binding domain
VQRILDAMTGAPAFARNGRMDLLAANRLGRALYSQHFDSAHGPPNSARFIFLDPRATDFYVDWEQVATDAVAILRSEAGRDPYDRDLSDLVGELSTRSDKFRTRWAAHDVRFHDTGFKRFHHPVVGDLSLTFETMAVTADEGRLVLFVYTAEPGSKSEQALNLLASWTATLDQPEIAHATDEA